MTLLTTPNVQLDTTDTTAEPINLYQLGMLFVVKCRYWSCRAGNDPDELDLTPDRIDARAIASFGTKDLLDPEKIRKVLQAIEKKARHALEKHSRPFAAANAHFVPWNHPQDVIDRLEALRAEFCDQVISQKGQVHGKTLNAIRDRIDKFHSMNVFGDADAAGKLAQLKQQIAGLTGQDLAQQPDVAERLSRACQTLKNHILNPENINALTGRLKRRVVLD